MNLINIYNIRRIFINVNCFFGKMKIRSFGGNYPSDHGLMSFHDIPLVYYLIFNVPLVGLEPTRSLRIQLSLSQSCIPFQHSGICTLRWIRATNLWFRRPTLSPFKLQGHCGGNGNRTHVVWFMRPSW
jgi:hypothetical protein